MSEPKSSAAGEDSRNQRLEQILADYLRAKEAGEQVDPQLIIAAHPDLADDLRSFFQNHAAVNQLAAPLREALAPQDTPTLDQSAGDSAAVIGSRLKYFGDYELLDEIARGGMGVVFKAKQLSLRRIVAVKMILAGQLAGDSAKQRFRSEAEAAAQLDHPNIVPIFEIGEHAQQHYFSMAYIEGKSLADLVRGQPLPEERAAKYLRAIAVAIHYAHGQGVLHRDLKPSNVLIDVHDQPRVTDFGLAKSTNATAGMTATGDVLGTPSYMPPEQAAGKSDDIGPASDVYSLGAMLYELVTGRPPFKAATPLDTVLQVMTAEPAQPRVLNPAISKDLETIILKCLRKESATRYSTAQALADDLLALLEGRPIQARRPGVLEHAVRWWKKQSRSAVIAAVASAAALLLAGGIIWGWQTYQHSLLGSITLATSGPPLKAELLNEYHERVVPSFTVPTEQPIQVTTGSYWLRISSPQQASETLQIDVPAGKTITATVQLPPRQFRVTKNALPSLPEQLYLGPEPQDEFQHKPSILTEEVPDSLLPAADTSAGKFARLQPRLGFTPVAQPRWIELDQPCVVLLRREANKTLTMLAVEVKSAQIVWEQPLRAFWPLAEYYGQSWEGNGPPWPLVEDLDGDGGLELIVPEFEPIATECTLGIAVHDARTGHRKWGRSLHPTMLDKFGQTTILRVQFDKTDPQSSKPPLRFIAGRDLNGDGVRDLYAATVQQRQEHRRSELNLLNCLALSGRDGATIWHWQTPAEFSTVGGVSPLQWWRTDHDGWPELLVPFSGSDSDQVHRGSFVLSSREGRLRQVLPGLTSPRTADLNGDGTPDVYDAHDAGWRYSETHPVSALSGEPRLNWQRIGVGRPLADLDGDGTRELNLDGGEIVSGGSGSILWRLADKVDRASAEYLLQLNLDCNQDGSPDLVCLDRYSTKTSLIALSGKTGALLWRQPVSTPDGLGNAYRLEFAEAHDVTGDERPELLISFFVLRNLPGGDPLYRHCLQACDAATGARLWLRQQSEETKYHGEASERADRVVSRDLNGDGKPDLILWSNRYRAGAAQYNSQQPPNSLVALQGDTGQPLWDWQLPDEYVLQHEHDFGDNPGLPRPAVTDLNDDGCDDVVVMYIYYSQTNPDERRPDDQHYFEIRALDGRTGETLWKHRQQDIGGYSLAPGYHHPSPRVARINGQPHLVARLPQQPDPERGGYRDYTLCLFNAQGQRIQPAEGLSSKDLNAFYQEHEHSHFWIADLDADGDDEVLAVRGGRLIAWEDGITQTLWHTQLLPLSENEKLPAGVSDARLPFQVTPPASVVREPLREEQDSNSRWTCEVEIVPAAQPGQPPRLTVTCSAGLFGVDPRTGTPQWHARWSGERMHSLQDRNASGLPLVLSQSAGKVVSAWLPQAQPGVALPPVTRFMDNGPPNSPRLPRSLPWAGEFIRWNSWVGGYFWFHSRSAYPTAFGLAFLALAVWVQILARQSQSRRGVWISWGCAAVGVILCVVQFDPYIIWLTAKYGLTFVLPVLTFAIVLLVDGWRQRWRRVGFFVGAAMAISLIVALIWLLIDLPRLASNERYVASQDWSIVLVGIYAVGVALLLQLVWRAFAQRTASQPAA